MDRGLRAFIVQAWDGQGFFPRPAEIAYIQANMALRKRKLLVLSGPARGGKKVLADEVCSILST